MSNPSDERKNAAKRNAERHFTTADRRDALVKEEQEKQRAQTAFKIAKLRALRLAREYADKDRTTQGR
jgi:hypothetical protein